MSVSTKFVLEQGPALKGMGETALGALKQRLGMAPAPAGEPCVPGPEVRATYPPPSPALVRAYVKHVGGDPGSYKRRVPAHLFPQWGFGLTGKTLEGLPYPMLAAMNGGCKLVQNGPLPLNEPLEVSARLESIDDDGRRAILEQRIVTSTRSAPEAVVAHLYIFVPLGSKKKDGADGKAEKAKKKKDKPRVPAEARELAYWRLRADAGLDFAKLTGDFNPVHWVPAYARAFGFRNTILHGFGTMARAIEGMNRALFVGDVDALKEIHVRFTRPLVLPARVGLYVHDHEVFVGDAPGGPAYLTGTFVTAD
ncbi:MAG TPA: MaoC/PaaZ C-terminal domain-containing protein [Sandaracinaceae bacterium LLY-WYZ-13_1]|nr:MaoC/PaaZ C-terminal domain-containing protein [Sandaracinaceae bacterium LLY-WYZ-13_1]